MHISVLEANLDCSADMGSGTELWIATTGVYALKYWFSVIG